MGHVKGSIQLDYSLFPAVNEGGSTQAVRVEGLDRGVVFSIPAPYSKFPLWISIALIGIRILFKILRAGDMH